MKLNLKIVLLSLVGIVGLSTLKLSTISGYGTVLFQIVALGAWGVVASVTSEVFADQNNTIVWVTALVINVFLFVIPAIAFWLVLKKRWPLIYVGVLLVWFLFYLSALFFLFPATDGP